MSRITAEENMSVKDLRFWFLFSIYSRALSANRTFLPVAKKTKHKQNIKSHYLHYCQAHIILLVPALQLKL